jgi:hypothetical protein
LLNVRIYRSYSQNVVAGLTTLSDVLLLELVSEFLIFLIVNKQMIPGLLAGLVRRCIFELDMIMGGTFGCGIPISLMIVHTKVATACMQDDVIIVNIRVASSTWPITVD